MDSGGPRVSKTLPPGPLTPAILLQQGGPVQTPVPDTHLLLRNYLDAMNEVTDKGD